jgi:hypothetical protein
MWHCFTQVSLPHGADASQWGDYTLLLRLWSSVRLGGWEQHQSRDGEQSLEPELPSALDAVDHTAWQHPHPRATETSPWGQFRGSLILLLVSSVTHSWTYLYSTSPLSCFVTLSTVLMRGRIRIPPKPYFTPYSCFWKSGRKIKTV